MDDRPNILFIMTDQQRGDCLSIEGHPVLLTPTMDGIAANGTRFSKAYVTCPSCVAARRSLLSGQTPQTHGLVGYQDSVLWDPPSTVASTLRDAGYQTHWVGRSIHQHPIRKRFGFDHMEIHGDNADYGEYLRERAPDGGGWMGAGITNNDWTARPWHLPEHLHNTNWTVDRALHFLRHRDPTVPFFLCVSFISPHPPLVPPATYFERYLRTGVPDRVIGDWALPPCEYERYAHQAPNRIDLTGEALLSTRAAYYGLINHVDDQMQRLLNPVSGIDGATGGNTAVIFTSDHGEMLGDHYHWRKQVPYEPSARIPLLIKPPRKWNAPRHQVSDALACLEDIYPTCCDFAGVDIPASVEGRSLMPHIRGESPSAWREQLHIEHSPSHQTLTNGREKFVWLQNEDRELFFDLTTDPTELHNLAADPAHAERVDAWRRRLITALTGRPEGFTDGTSLIPHRPYPALLPHGGTPDTATPLVRTI